MYQTSEQFNSAILGDYRKFQSKLRIGTSEVTEGFRSIKQTIRSANGDNISVGGAISSYIEVEMWHPQLLLGNAEIEWILTLELPSGGIEEIPMGLFTVQDPKEDDGVVRFAAYDRIYSKMGMPYFSELNYPADGKDILREISSQTGVPIDVSTLPDGVLVDRIKISSGQSLDENGNAVTNETFSNPFDGYIHREALGNIAMIYGRIAVMDRAGNVVFKWYSNADYSVGIDRHYGDLVLNESVFSVGTISCQTGSSVLTSGSGTENVYLENNIMTQSKLDAIYQQFQALEYIPATFSFLGDSRLDICDIITVHDIKGNLIKVPLMEIVQEYDGGLLTRVKSFGGVNQESSAVKGPTVQKMDRMYTELFLAKELIGNKATFEDLKSINAEFRVMKADMITAEFIETRYAKIDLANIKAGSITSAMLGTAVVGTTQIADGSITDAKIVDLTANKINAGTLSVERLEIRGSNKSIVYALNNITGALQSQNVNTLNGEILTQRSITADKIVANSITGNEIAAKTINANNINVTDLFAQDITATGKIRGMELIGVTGDFTGTVTAEGSLRVKSSDNKYGSMSMQPGSYSIAYPNGGGAWGVNTNALVFTSDTYCDFRSDYTFFKGISADGYVFADNFVENGKNLIDKYLSREGGYVDGEIINTYPNALRMACGTYGAILRNDGSNVYILLTDSGAATTGSWNSLRPFTITNSNGYVSIGNGLSVEGGLTTGAILNMGVASKTGTERQIKFEVSAGTYQHLCTLYGGNSNSTTAIGVWDGKNSRVVWYYNDVDNLLCVTPTIRAEQHGVSWGEAVRGMSALNVYAAGDYSAFNALATVRTIVGAWSMGALNPDSSFYIVYANESIVTGTENSTTCMFKFGTDGTFSANNGYLKSTANGNTVTIGSQNGGWCHFENSADIPFHFNRRVSGAGGFEVYNTSAYWSAYALEFLYSTSAVEMRVNMQNSNMYGRLCNSSAGNFGLYNVSKSSWGVKMTNNGTVYLGVSDRAVVPPNGSAAIRGNGDGSYDSGHTSYRWNNVYSKNGVKTTSDEREKDILPFDLTDMSAYFMSLNPIAFRWKYGNDRKIHLGVGAQTTERKMIEAGFAPSQFDMIQHDDLEERSVSGLMERYGINYQDLNMLTMMQTQKTTRDLWKLQDWALSTDIELAVINQKQETQEARIRDLELQLADALFEIEQLKARIA